MSVGATVLTGPRRTEAARRAGELEAARTDLGEVAAAIRVRQPPPMCFTVGSLLLSLQNQDERYGQTAETCQLQLGFPISQHLIATSNGQIISSRFS